MSKQTHQITVVNKTGNVIDKYFILRAAHLKSFLNHPIITVKHAAEVRVHRIEHGKRRFIRKLEVA